jgi:RNA polymerase sigma-70 factor, ECF subfamily
MVAFDIVADTADVEAAIADALRRCRAAWPTIAVPATFAATLSAEAAELATLHVTDLYLAHACVAGSSEAIAAFEQTYGAVIDDAVRALGLEEPAIADVAQEVRTHLLVAPPGGQPKLAAYPGRSTLHNWVRTLAARRAASASHRPVDVVDDGELDARVLADLPNAEQQHFRATYRMELKQAFESALATLTPQQRNLLRHRYVDELTVEAIGALYGVHKATASRWIDEARGSLAKRTRNAFVQRTRVTPSELQSIVHLLESHVELSLRRVLASAQ